MTRKKTFSVDKKTTRCHFVLSFVSPLQVAQHVSATMCLSSGADDCVVLSPRVGTVPWLQEGCQDRLAGSVSIEEFVAQLALLARGWDGRVVRSKRGFELPGACPR